MKKFSSTVAIFAALGLLATACSEAEGDRDSRSKSSGKIKVDEVAEGLKVGWDVGFLPDGNVLIPEREGRLSVVSPKKSGEKLDEVTEPQGSKVTTVKADLPEPYVKAEGGLLGMVLHPDFEKSRKFTLCQTTQTSDGKPKDIRLITWKLSKDNKKATKVKNLLTGLPLHESGQHVGCKPTIAPDGSLLIGTGDARLPGAPQDKKDLAGKVLRVDLDTGKGLPDNPFADSDDENTQRIFSYGHRNVQGVTVRPGSEEIWTVEHGPDRDDEVNTVEAGKNYGWDPSKGGKVTKGYPEMEVPMTDKDQFPEAVDAKWATGVPTEALTQAVFLDGDSWGELEGNLAVTSLKGSKLFLLDVDDKGRVTQIDAPKELYETYKRLRAARIGPDGALYVTTAGGENDYLLRIKPGK